MDIIIDKMTSEDVSGVTIIEKECFTNPWSYDAFLSELENDKAITFVAIADHVVVGFINGRVMLDEGYINNVAVTKNYRRKNIADMLINKLIEFAKQKKLAFLTLEVRKSNQAGIELYKKHGFCEVGMRKNFYNKPSEDALLMTLNFED